MKQATTKMEIDTRDIADRVIKKMRAANVSHDHIRMQNRYNGEENTMHSKFDTELHGMFQLLKAMGIGYAVEWDEKVEDYAAFIIDGITYTTEKN